MFHIVLVGLVSDVIEHFWCYKLFYIFDVIEHFFKWVLNFNLLVFKSLKCLNCTLFYFLCCQSSCSQCCDTSSFWVILSCARLYKQINQGDFFILSLFPFVHSSFKPNLKRTVYYNMVMDVSYGCFMMFSTKFHLYCGSQCYWKRKP